MTATQHYILAVEELAAQYVEAPEHEAIDARADLLNYLHAINTPRAAIAYFMRHADAAREMAWFGQTLDNLRPWLAGHAREVIF